MAIIPRDPITKAAWKNSSFNYLSKQTGIALQKGLERHAYMYDEIVVSTRYPVDHEMKLANFGLVHLLGSPSEHYTFSPETSQKIILNGSLGYFLSITDPVFSVLSSNPETIPRTLINLPAGGGTFQIYLTVKPKLTQTEIRTNTSYLFLTKTSLFLRVLILIALLVLVFSYDQSMFLLSSWCSINI